MKSRTRFSASGFKGRALLSSFICVVLLNAVSVLAQAVEEPSAETVQPPQEALPGVTEQEPSLENAPITESLNARILEELVHQEIFPDMALENPEVPVSKANLARIITRSLNHSLSYVSEFPFFRDVPKSHWAYKEIEVARERQLMTEAERGFYLPEDPVSHLYAYQVLGRALAGKLPSPEISEMILEPFDDLGDLPPEVRPEVAKLVNANIIPVSGRDSDYLKPEQPVTYLELAPMVSQLVLRTASRQFFLPVDEKALPVLEPGIVLSLGPANALFRERLSVGDTVYFILLEPVADLPKGGRLRGRVVESYEEKTYVVVFDQLKTPEGGTYQTHARLVLEYPEGEGNGFILPGNVFQIETQLPPEVLPSPVPQPAQPPASSGSTLEPNSGQYLPELSESDLP